MRPTLDVGELAPLHTARMLREATSAHRERDDVDRVLMLVQSDLLRLRGRPERLVRADRGRA